MQHVIAVKQYSQATKMLPEEDEIHCCTSLCSLTRCDMRLKRVIGYLHCMNDPMLEGDAPKDQITGVAKSIQDAHFWRWRNKAGMR